MSLLPFPDVNVWVALHHEVHEHHELAMHWFESLDQQATLVFCRQTQLGFFRLLTTTAVMGDEALTQKQCWALYRRWLGEGKALFRTEPIVIEDTFQRRTMSEVSSPKEWMDAYLAAFAECGDLTLITFDRALATKAKGAVLLA